GPIDRRRRVADRQALRAARCARAPTRAPRRCHARPPSRRLGEAAFNQALERGDGLRRVLTAGLHLNTVAIRNSRLHEAQHALRVNLGTVVAAEIADADAALEGARGAYE